MTFQQYATLARRLDAVRRGEAELTAGQRKEVEEGRVTLDRLVDRLTEQQAALTEAAGHLRIRMPLIDPAPSSALTAREALTQAEAATAASDHDREYALERAVQPRFLPGATTLVRNGAVYGLCAGAAVVVSLMLQVVIGDNDRTTVMLWSLLGLPMVAFFVGYLLIGIVGVPRIPPLPPTHDDRGLPLPPSKRVLPPLRRTPRLGLAICFVAVPLFWLLVS